MEARGSSGAINVPSSENDRVLSGKGVRANAKQRGAAPVVRDSWRSYRLSPDARRKMGRRMLHQPMTGGILVIPSDLGG